MPVACRLWAALGEPPTDGKLPAVCGRSPPEPAGAGSGEAKSVPSRVPRLVAGSVSVDEESRSFLL